MMTRDDLLAAAQRQLNGNATASMAAIAESAGIGRATLHRHFATREALLTEIGIRSMDRWESRLEQHDVAAVAASADAERISDCLAGLVADFVADAEDFGFALTDDYMCTADALAERSEALFDREVELYAAAQRVGVLRSDVTARWLGHAIYGLLVAARDALREGDIPRRDLESLVLDTFLRGSAR